MGMTKWFCCDFWQTGKREKRQLSVDIREERTNKSLSSATFAAKWVLLESEKKPSLFPYLRLDSQYCLQLSLRKYKSSSVLFLTLRYQPHM